MLRALLVFQLCDIALRDIRTLRITNLSLVCLVVTLILSGGDESHVRILAIALPILLLFYLCGIGMGDVKLLMILIYFTPSLIINLHYLYGVAVGAIVSMVVFRRAHTDERIPFAPALVAPYVALYLVM